MPTRDDAAYKDRYADALAEAAGMSDDILMQHVGILQRPRTVGEQADVDACTDELVRRGLCASVLDWHKKPAGDELPW